MASIFPPFSSLTSTEALPSRRTAPAPRPMSATKHSSSPRIEVSYAPVMHVPELIRWYSFPVSGCTQGTSNCILTPSNAKGASPRPMPSAIRSTCLLVGVRASKGAGSASPSGGTASPSPSTSLVCPPLAGASAPSALSVAKLLS
eukprot:scaffold41261_cov337-Isochrysis_galbana.AAC.1